MNVVSEMCMYLFYVAVVVILYVTFP
jgi:hypothetical protein